MEASGVRFAVNDARRFETLRSLYAEVKRDKDGGRSRDPAEWVRLVPDEIKGRFSWPTDEERRRWLAVRDSTITAIPDVSRQLGAEWDFYRVFEAMGGRARRAGLRADRAGRRRVARRPARLPVWRGRPANRTGRGVRVRRAGRQRVRQVPAPSGVDGLSEARRTGLRDADPEPHVQGRTACGSRAGVRVVPPEAPGQR